MGKLKQALRGFRLTYARVMVVLTVAVVVLGGGYSLAANLKGSGTLQKENEIGVATSSTPEVIRTIKGVGEITAYDCDVSSPPTVTSIGFRNTSGETLRIWIDQAIDAIGPTEDPLILTLANGNSAELFGTSLAEVGRVHVFPADASKRPQAKINVSYQPDNDSCDDAQVSVLNWTTEE